MRQCMIKTAADMEAGHIVCSAPINMEFHAEQAAVCLINDTIHEKLVKKPTYSIYQYAHAIIQTMQADTVKA